MSDNRLLADTLQKIKGKKTKVHVSIPEVHLTFYGELTMGFDSRLDPPHRIHLDDHKGNTVLLNLDKKRLNVLFS